MNRRLLTAGMAATAITWPIGVLAQSGRKPAIGVLYHSNPEPSLSQFRAAMTRLGHRVGETVDLDVRVANGSDTRLAEFAADLVARRVDLICALTTPAAIAAKAATSSIPIVMTAADPVGSGLVSSLARPGGNVTGVSLAVRDVSGKLLGLLREAVPSAHRLGLLVNDTDPFFRQLIEGVEEANLIVKTDLRIHRVSRPDELETAFETMTAERIDATIVQPTLPRAAVIALAIRHKLPTGQPVGGYANAGGFLSYSAKPTEVAAVTAAQVDQILRGGKPADIPVRQPTKFEMVLNLATARALDLTVPPMLLAQADEIIE